jgi:hypothetical protein
MKDACCPLLFYRELYMESKRKNPSITRHYKDYFKISAKFVERAKNLEYDDRY